MLNTREILKSEMEETARCQVRAEKRRLADKIASLKLLIAQNVYAKEKAESAARMHAENCSQFKDSLYEAEQQLRNLA